MGDYNAYRHGDANAIEMGMPGQRIPTNQSSTTFSQNDAYIKNEHSLDDDLNEPETDYQPVDWKRVFFSKKYLPVWIVLIIVGILTAVITLKHDQVVEALRPFAEKVRDIPAGWLIFVAVLFVISFPPLFGHELVALLAGVVYGLWLGFAVVAAGTFVGESECYPRIPFGQWDCMTNRVWQSVHGSLSRDSSVRKQRRWSGRTSPTALWRNSAVMVASGYVQSIWSFSPP